VDRGMIPALPAAARPRADLAGGLLVFAVVFGNYLLSTPRTVMLDDDGFFIMAAWFNGVAHPPGYPLYTFLAHLATYLPFGSVAWRVHLFSALCGALACAFLWRFARQLLDSRLYAFVAALAFGFSGTFWSQSIVAEVYSLNMLLLAALLSLCAAYARDPRAVDRRPLLIAFLYGLSLTNHWPLMGLCTPALAAVLWPQRRALLRQLPALALCVLAGLLPYAWMVLRSQVSEFSFYGPIENGSDFWFYLSRQGYAGADHSLTAGWPDKGRFAAFVLGETARQFGVLGAPLLLIGFARQWKAWPANVCLALALIFLGSTFVLIFLLDFDYDLWNRNIFQVYPIPAYAAAALWLALGLKASVNWASARMQRSARRGFLRFGAAALLVLSAWAGNAPQNFRTGDAWAADYARAVLSTLPPDAVLFVSGDYTTGPVGYLNRVERLRPDVTLMSDTGLVFGNRLFKPMSRTPGNMQEVVNDFIRSTDRRVFYFPSLPHRHHNTFYGLYFEVLEGGADTSNRAVATPRVLDYFARAMLREEPRDMRERIHYRYLKSSYCGLVANVVASPGHGADVSAPVFDLARGCNDFYGLMSRAAVALGRKDPDHAAALGLLRMAERHIDEVVQIRDLAALYHLSGRSHEAAGDHAQAAAYHAKSIALLPTTDNPSYQHLKKLRRPAGGG
jgi:hypothetical protein